MTQPAFVVTIDMPEGCFIASKEKSDTYTPTRFARFPNPTTTGMEYLGEGNCAPQWRSDEEYSYEPQRDFDLRNGVVEI